MEAVARCDVCIPANCDDRCGFVTVPDYNKPDEQLAAEYWQSVAPVWMSGEGMARSAQASMWNSLVFACRDSSYSPGWIYHRKMRCHFMPLDPTPPAPKAFFAAWRVFLAEYGYELVEISERGDGLNMRVHPAVWPPPIWHGERRVVQLSLFGGE